MKLLVLLFVLCVSCKSSLHTKLKKIGMPIEDTLFENSKNEEYSINSYFHALEQRKTILVLFNGKKISFEKFEKKVKRIDSTYTMRIIKEKKELENLNIKETYKVLLIVDKKT